jgi:diacylglycerol kinase (ATP)
MRRRILVICNPCAARGKKVFKNIREIAGKIFKEKEIAIDLVYLQNLQQNKLNKVQMEEAIQKSYKCIGVVGGDGTVNIVINLLKDIKIPLVVIPAGTGNDLARELGILNLKKAFNILLSDKQKIKEIDLCQVKWQGRREQEYRRYFVNNFSLGFDVEVVRYVEQLKRKFRSLLFLPGFGIFCYFISVLRMLFSFKANTEISIEIENTQGLRRRINGAIMSLIICNNPRYGRYFHLAPDAKMDDGKFSVCIIPKMSKLLFLLVILEALSGRLNERLGKYIYNDVEKIWISLKRPGNFLQTNVQVDGEIFIVKGKIEISFGPKKAFMI